SIGVRDILVKAPGNPLVYRLMALQLHYNQRAKALLLTQDLTQQEGELPPGTFAPQNPILEEVLTPAVNPVRQAAEDLELLTQILCDRISLRLNLEMERNGFHQSNRIFSRQTIPVQSSSKSEHAPDVIEQLAEEIEQLLHQRLVHEREDGEGL
ncbi:MAG: hypothetical protein ACYTXY_42190, partial [Nostoc sp.]